jgi:ribosome-binding protein aMBF1 (putative translation factor)
MLSEKLQNIPTDTSWMERAEQYIKNKRSVDRSTEISIQILSRLRTNRKIGNGIKTQAELAETLNISPQYVNKLLRVKEIMPLPWIEQVEDALGIRLLYLESDLMKVKQQVMVTKKVPITLHRTVSFNQKGNSDELHFTYETQDKNAA